MKKLFLILAFLFYYNFSFSQDTTKIPKRAGIVLAGSEQAMIWHDMKWNLAVEPLTILYVGDSVKVMQKENAEVILWQKGLNKPLIKLHFGDSTYFVKDFPPGTNDAIQSASKQSKSRWQNFWRDIVNAFVEAEIPLRRASSRSETGIIISPHDSYILPSKIIKLEWYPGIKEKYNVHIRDKQNPNDIFIINDLEGTELVINPSLIKLRNGKTYCWSVSNGLLCSDSTEFKIAKDSLAHAIIDQLDEIENSFDYDDFDIPKILTQVVWLQENKFFYDARRILFEALKKHPNNNELRILFDYTSQ